MIRKIIKMLKIVFEKKENSPNVSWVEINSDKKKQYENYEIPKLIWIYWDSEVLPEIVRMCVEQVEKVCIGYKVVVLNNKNVNDYITLPEVNEVLPKSNVADIIRLLLLKKYGGIWMDASIFLTESIEWITSRMFNQEAFLFYSNECTTNIDKPISENWFIVCPKESEFIQLWLKEFESCATSDDPKNYYANLDRKEELLQGLTRPDYLLCYISAIVVLDKHDFNILYASSESTGHYFNYKYDWDGTYVATELLLKNKSKVAIPKLIKFNSSTRKGVERFIKKGLYTKNSLLGSYISALKK